MLRRITLGQALMALAGIATLAHLSWRWFDRRGGLVTSVSELQVGQALPPIALESLGVVTAGDPRPSLPAGCKILVYFTPDCQHCGTAARLDASSTETNPVPVIWLTNTRDSSLSDFIRSVRPGTPVYFAENGRSVLQVRAFPAAFLVSADGIIRLIFPYQGGLPQSRLRPYCDAHEATTQS